MPLAIPQLQNAFLDIAKNYPGDSRDSAKKFAAAYSDYAAGATSLGKTPQFTGAEKTLFENTLAPTMLDPRTGNPATWAAAWQTAVTAYWTAPPVAFLGPPLPAVVTGPPGPIAPGLQGALAAPQPAEAWAISMATILHTATLIVIVTHPQPPPAPPVLAPLL